MSSTDPLDESLASLSHFFIAEATMQETLQNVVALVERAVPTADMAGITMMVDGKVKTAFFNDEETLEIDKSQYEINSGPCLFAYRNSQVTRIESTATETRWPEFAQMAFRHGVRSTMSLPLMAHQRGLGALNLYSRDEGAFSENDEHRGSAFATQASIVLANTQTYQDVWELNLSLQRAMESRAIIEQAKGILMGQSHVSADRAFEMLREASQRTNRKLRDLAQELVDKTSLPKS